MSKFLKFYEKYSDLIAKLRFDPLILFISANFSHSLKGWVALYLILVLAIHLPIIFYKN